MARLLSAIIVTLAGCDAAAGPTDSSEDIDAPDTAPEADAIVGPGDADLSPDGATQHEADGTTGPEDDVGQSDAAADAAPSDTAMPARDFGPPIPAALAAALQAVLDANFGAVNAAAVAIGVRLPDGSWWEGVSGEACHEPATGVAVGDRFRLGSITKTWVAAAVLQLVAEGRVSLDGPVEDHVPGFDLGSEITVRHCLSHTSGIFDLTDDVLSIDADFRLPIDPGEILRQSLARGPDFAPGTRWEYSNTNYFVLGLLIEQVTGEPLARALRERTLDPLELRDTFLEDAEPASTTFVCGNFADVDVTDLLDMSWSWAAGAMVSSNGDLCRWADALWRGAVLPPTLRDAMVTPTPLPDGSAIGYGLGTMLRMRGGLPVVGHTGQTLGFQSELFIDPVSGLCVAVLANDFGASPEAVAAPAWDVLVPAIEQH